MALGETLKNRSQFVHPKLQITAMMDMFTIIVFFLLFSYAEKPDEIDMKAEISLPDSSSQRDYDNTIKIFLSDKSLTLEDKVIAKIVNGKIIGYDAKNPKDSGIYQELKLFKERKEAEEKAAAGSKNQAKASDVGNDKGEKENLANKSHILFFCDKNVSFKVMNSVMKTIGMVGYPNIQLAVTGTD